ncbi:MAG: hypothetical protein R3A13_04840 [Bdellovibrionota bacterium]
MKYFILVVSLIVFPGICFAADLREEINDQAKQLMEKHKNIPSFSLVGEIQSGQNERFSVNGEDFSVADNALITGNLRVGKQAKVRGQIKAGKKVATSISITEEIYPKDPDSEAAAM